jgi:hypothetical protein
MLHHYYIIIIDGLLLSWGCCCMHSVAEYLLAWRLLFFLDIVLLEQFNVNGNEDTRAKVCSRFLLVKLLCAAMRSL